MLWEGTLFIIEVLSTAAILIVAATVPFKTTKEAVRPINRSANEPTNYGLKKAA